MTSIKMRISALIAAIKAYKASVAASVAAEEKRQRDEMFRQAAKSDPLSILFEAKYCRAGREADRRL